MQIAGTSVMISESRDRTGTRILGFTSRKDSGKDVRAAETRIGIPSNSSPASRKRMWGAREQAPGA